MTFMVTSTKWLETELARVTGIILMPRFWGVKWTRAKLRKELAEIGLTYSPSEIDELNTALHTAGVVEDIPEV